MEGLGVFLIAVGITLCTVGGTFWALVTMDRRKQKFKQYISNLKTVSEMLQKAQESYHPQGTLHFRDKTGKLCTVEIVIDPHLEEMEPDDKWEKIENIEMPRHGVLDQAERVIFSSQAAASIAARGESLDDVVMNMLRAAGRID